jgi:undecaprenyl pyrophosphate phosphatase UppP
VLRAFIIGIVQGLTEFLPISSSAHLSIVPKLLGYEQPTLSFEILLHFGTLTAVVTYFHRDLWAFVLCLVAPGRLGPVETRQRRRMLLLLLIGSIPVGIFGLLLQDWADGQTSQALRTSILLVLTTAFMIGAELYARRHPPAGVPADPADSTDPSDPAYSAYSADPADPAISPSATQAGRPAQAPAPARAGSPATAGTVPPAMPAAGVPGAVGSGEPVRAHVGTTRMERIHHRSTPEPSRAAVDADATRELERLPWPKALWIGAAQACALVPGVSRSGATISAGLLLGVTREAAARMSFLLSIPAILGAGVLKLDELGQGFESTPELIVGFLASAISGFLAISWLLKLLRTRTLWPFIWYRLIAGPIFIVLLLTLRS